MATDTTPFSLSSLVGGAGVGDAGEKLVNTLIDHYPADLRSALTKRPNHALMDDIDPDKLAKDAAKIAGVPEVLDVCIRGGERSADDAIVSYVYENDRGDMMKGAFPYRDLGKASSKGHVSQRDSLAASAAARDHETAQAKAREAAGSSGAPDSGPADPVASYEELTANEVVAYLDANPGRADVIKALETATRGEDARKTILNWEPPKAPEGEGG